MSLRTRASWALVGLLAIGRLGCVPQDDPAEVDPLLAAVLADTWPMVVLPALDDAAAAAAVLASACAAWDGSTGAGQVEAQEAWYAAMAAWQRVEPMQIGPLGASITVVGGQDLRDEVYSWPTVNPCAVDELTAGETWRASDFTATHLVNVYGLDALETLLFSPAGVNACPGDAALNTDGSWQALGAEAIQANRAGYAAAVAAAVARSVDDARVAGEAFAPDFASAVPYESPQSALNAIFDALYYLETRVKDDKLGGPLGLMDCGGACLPVETPVAGGSNAWIAANLEGFRTLFLGGEGHGLDDLLEAGGHEDHVSSLLSALDAADAAAAALVVAVDVAAASDPAPALALHAAIDEVGQVLRGEVAPALLLQIPAEAAGDND